MADEAAHVAEDQEEEKKRRRLIIWILFGAAVLILVLLLVLCSSDDEPIAAPTTTTTTTTTTAAPTTTAAAPTTTAPPTTTTTAPPETTTTTAVLMVDGVWSFTVDVTVATRGCRGEENEKPYHRTVTIITDGEKFTAVGLGNPRDEQVWEGEIEDNVIMFGGSRREDDGVTTALFTMTIDEQFETMTGIEEWTWKGPGGPCDDSLSEVTAARLSG